MLVLVSNRGAAVILGGIVAISAVTVLAVRVFAKPVRQLWAEPAQGRPGDPWVLYVKNFLGPTITIVVQGYNANPDMTYVRNFPGGTYGYNFTVEADRPPGQYWVTVLDSEEGRTIWFTVLP